MMVKAKLVFRRAMVVVIAVNGICYLESWSISVSRVCVRLRGGSLLRLANEFYSCLGRRLKF